MHVLAIDPGIHTGGALWPDGREPITFLIVKPTAKQIYGVMRWAMAICDAKPMLVTEDQFLARGSKANPQAMLEVARSAEMWLTIAELLGCEREQVSASTWREPLIAGIEGGNKKARTRVAVERKWPQVLFGTAGIGRVEDVLVPTADKRDVPTADKRDVPQDTIDALGMVYWAKVLR